MSDTKDKNLQLDLTDDFKCGELLLDADEDREAFKLFLRVAVDEKRQDAIDKLLYIALKNSHNAELLDNDTWDEIEKLSMKRKEGYEYAYLLLHFRYYAMGVDNGKGEKALKYLKKYIDKLKKNENDISPIAYLQMGICFAWGIGIKAEEISDKKALAFYRKAAKKGCVDAYRFIVSSYLYGGTEIAQDLSKAKRELDKGMKCLVERFNNGEREVIPFFGGLVRRCFVGEWSKMKDEVEKEGKDWAQYMIDEGIKEGYSMMGYFFLSNDVEFNTTIARNYYEEAMKHNEASAYWGMAVINLLENKYEEAYKFACRGKGSPLNSTFGMLGQMYEKRGDNEKYENNKNKAKKCYYKAWEYYEKGYCLFGWSSDDLGKLYLNKSVMPNGFDFNTLEDYLEHSAMVPNPEAIKYYLRLIQKKCKLDFDKIDFRCIYKLPSQYGKKYRKFLQIGADMPDPDVDLLSEYARLLMCEWKKVRNEEEKGKRLVYIVRAAKKVLFGAREFGEFVVAHADEETKAKFLENLLKERIVLFIEDVKFIYNHTDEGTKEKLFKKLAKEAGDSIHGEEKIEFIYRMCADKKIKAKLSKNLVDDSYIAKSKERFIDVLENYKDRQDDSFTDWLSKSLTILFLSENENKVRELSSEFESAIEKSADEGLKEQVKILKERFLEGEESEEEILLSIMNHQELIVHLMSIIENSNDEILKGIVEKCKIEFEKFIDSFDAEQ